MLDKFINVEKIGSGSYSTVYKAQRKTGSKEVVAIKVVEKTKLSSRGKNDIVTEIQVMKLMKHKYIVDMKDFEWDDKNIYIIMEYCDGGDLSGFIKKRCKLPESTCQKFLQQLAVGLQFLRSHNVSHLDLKPQNLLLVTKPTLSLKIGDFGFAQFLVDSTVKSSIRGSPLYMAPEMLLGGKYDAKADLWSVGVIAYECLFGKAPFSSSSYSELYGRIKSNAPVIIPSDAGLTKDCRNFLKNLLTYDPKQRMSYEAFFNHTFLDLEHVPSEVSYKKAIEILNDAIALDNASQHVEAFNRYCEGLRYLLPILKEETVEKKKILIRSKVCQYTRRAEELKCMLALSEEMKSEPSSPVRVKEEPAIDEVDSVVIKKTANMDLNKEVTLNRMVSKNNTLKQLKSLCKNTPNLATAVEIGMNGQMYLAEGKYELALEKFQSSLGILVTTLNAEPAGPRRDLLYLQTEEWMKQAESCKSLVKLKDTSNEDATPNVENKEMCAIQ